MLSPAIFGAYAIGGIGEQERSVVWGLARGCDPVRVVRVKVSSAVRLNECIDVPSDILLSAGGLRVELAEAAARGGEH